MASDRNSNLKEKMVVTTHHVSGENCLWISKWKIQKWDSFQKCLDKEAWKMHNNSAIFSPCHSTAFLDVSFFSPRSGKDGHWQF